LPKHLIIWVTKSTEFEADFESIEKVAKIHATDISTKKCLKNGN
jgi:hypothetical protein